MFTQGTCGKLLHMHPLIGKADYSDKLLLTGEGIVVPDITVYIASMQYSHVCMEI